MNDGLGFPLFRTKREAYQRTNDLILLEARHRAWVWRQAERAAASSPDKDDHGQP